MARTHGADPAHPERSKCGLVWWTGPDDPRRSATPSCKLCNGTGLPRGLQDGGWATRRARMASATIRSGSHDPLRIVTGASGPALPSRPERP